MRLIACIDENCGLMFNNRRVSSDVAVVDRIIKIVGDDKILVNNYSAPLFKGKVDNIIVDDNFLQKAKKYDYCFVENSDITQSLVGVNELILYYWNRKYPSDFKFPKEAAIKGKKLISTWEFVGNSHEKITEEVYR